MSGGGAFRQASRDSGRLTADLRRSRPENRHRNHAGGNKDGYYGLLRGSPAFDGAAQNV